MAFERIHTKHCETKRMSVATPLWDPLLGAYLEGAVGVGAVGAVGHVGDGGGRPAVGYEHQVRPGCLLHRLQLG